MRNLTHNHAAPTQMEKEDSVIKLRYKNYTQKFSILSKEREFNFSLMIAAFIWLRRFHPLVIYERNRRTILLAQSVYPSRLFGKYLNLRVNSISTNENGWFLSSKMYQKSVVFNSLKNSARTISGKTSCNLFFMTNIFQA